MQYKNAKGQSISLAKRMKLDEFVSRAKTAHNNKYDYSRSVYVNAHTKIEIICPVHGIFLQRPGDHVRSKNGCPECAKSVRSKSHSQQAFQKFLAAADKKHNGKYTYIESTFVSITAPMNIVCPIHGIFNQSPDVHKRAGCQRCGCGPISEASQQWLDSLKIPISNREKWINVGQKRIKVDGFDPATNTVYEFWGNYWHGNPRVYPANQLNSHNKTSFGSLYEQTQSRATAIKLAGFNLVQIWEDEWSKSTNNSSAR